jgi:PAS domain S-box-containing protein
MTDEQRIDRRERNREHAKRSRVRKKFLLESLQEQLLGLRGENTGLRQLVVDKCPQQKAEGILKNCMTEENFLLLESDLRLAAEETGGRAARQSNSASGGDAAAAGGGAASRQNTSRGLPDGVGGPDRNLTVPDYRLMLSLVNAQQNFTVSDPGLPDNPIVYASQGFLDLTGYSREQVLGRNCRFLQGPKTNPKMVDVIRKGVAAGDDTSVCLLNYKADGTTFWNQFFVAALRDLDGRVVNYVGVQCEVEASVAKQLPGIDNGTEEASGMSPPAPIQSFTNS